MFGDVSCCLMSAKVIKIDNCFGLNSCNKIITLTDQKLHQVVVKNVRILSWGSLNTNLVRRAIGIESRKVGVIGLSVRKIQWK